MFKRKFKFTMRKLFFPLLMLAGAQLLFAAMSDPAALREAQMRWGGQAMIGTGRYGTQSNWTKMVGVRSEGCQQPFTVIGAGFNTWDAAFAAADAKPFTIAGPFAGLVHVKAQAWDNTQVVAMKFWIDSNSMQQIMNPQVSNYFLGDFILDTTMLPNGVHVACANAFDPGDLVGRSPVAYLFRVDQTLGIANATLFVGQMVDGNPSQNAVEISR